MLQDHTQPAVALACVVLPIASDGAVLLSQRANRKRGTFSNLWVFPGGHVDPGETLAARDTWWWRRRIGRHRPQVAAKSPSFCFHISAVTIPQGWIQ